MGFARIWCARCDKKPVRWWPVSKSRRISPTGRRDSRKLAFTATGSIEGARILGLIDVDGWLTPKGATIADLLQGVGFLPENRPAKRLRLADAAPAVAAVARAVLLSQPAVHLVVETLRRAANGALGIPELLKAAMHRDEVLARALFLRNPDRDLNTPVAAIDFRTATVFQFKQILWHAGILASKAEVGAGGGANRYRPEDDRWSLDEHILRTPLAGVRRGAMGLPEPFRGT